MTPEISSCQELRRKLKYWGQMVLIRFGQVLVTILVARSDSGQLLLRAGEVVIAPTLAPAPMVAHLFLVSFSVLSLKTMELKQYKRFGEKVVAIMSMTFAVMRSGGGSLDGRTFRMGI